MILPKFVNRQNGNVRVDEDSLTDKDVRVKCSDRGSRSLRGPMEVSVKKDYDQGIWDRRARHFPTGVPYCVTVRDIREIDKFDK